MKNLLLLLIFPFWSTVSFAQQQAAAQKLVDEGVAYHDKGDYAGAIAKYDQALQLDKDNLLALAEKAYSLVVLGKNEEAIKYCQRALELHPGDDLLKMVYITYGNALDDLKRTDQALEIYDAGIRQFPEVYLFYFNKGVTLAGVSKYDEAIACFQQAVLLNPAHTNSHNGMARLLNAQPKTIPALLAYCRFLVREPQEKRAEENLATVQEIMKSHVEKTDKNVITITYDPDIESDTTTTGEKINDFSAIGLLLSLTSGLDYDKKYKKETDVERFIRKFETVCASLKEQQGKNVGFY